MKCKNEIFLNFERFFLKCTFLMSLHFFLASWLSNQLIVLVVVRISRLHVFDAAFSLLAAVAMITKREFFSYSYSSHCKENKFTYQNQAACHQSKLL